MSIPNILHFMTLLDDECERGEVAAAALLAAAPAARPSVLAEHPEWLCVGTFDVLLAAVPDELDRSALRAEELVTFVLAHLALLTAPPADDLLLDLVRGMAWKHRASVHYRQRQFQQALDAARAAVEIFTRRPGLVVDRAAALLVQAQVWHELGQTSAALQLLDDVEETFTAHGDALHWVQVLEQRGICLYDLGDENPRQYVAAQTVFLEAEAEARRIGAERELARIANNLGHCAVAIAQYSDAQRYFGRAFTAFHALRMEGEVQRTVWGIAEVAVARGQITEALDMLHVVYGEFLQRGMIATAALVLLDIGTIIADVTGDVTYAKNECARLEKSLGTYDLPTHVRAALRYLVEQAAAADTPAEFREDVAPVYAFFAAYEHSDATTFSPPA